MALEDNFPSCIGTILNACEGALVHVYALIGYILIAIILCKIVFGSFKKRPGLSWAEFFKKSFVRGYNPLITEDSIFTDCPLRNLILVHVVFYLLLVGHRALAIRQLIVEVRASRNLYLCLRGFQKFAHYVDKLHQGFQLSFLHSRYDMAHLFPFLLQRQSEATDRRTRQAYCSSKVVTF